MSEILIDIFEALLKLKIIMMRNLFAHNLKFLVEPLLFIEVLDASIDGGQIRSVRLLKINKWLI